MGYRTCYYRTFCVGGASQSQIDAYKQCREWLDDAIDLVRPGVTTDQIAEVWPTAEELGFPNEESCFGLQFGHGLGVGLYESPMISRLHSLDHPVEIEEGMVFALETYCAASDGRSAARIEEEVVVTADGREILTRFPAEELLVAARSTCAAPTSAARRGCRRHDSAPLLDDGDRPLRKRSSMSEPTTVSRDTPGTPRRPTTPRPLPADAPHPPLRGRRPVALPAGARCTAPRTCARARRRRPSACASVLGDEDRVGRHLPRPRSRAGARGRARGADGRDARPRDRGLRRRAPAR